MALATCLMEERGRHQLDTERMRMYFIIRIITFTIYIFIYIYIYDIYIRYLRYIYSHILYIHYIILYIPYYITYYIFSTRLLLILILFCVAIKGEPSGLGIGIDSQARFLVAKKHDIEA